MSGTPDDPQRRPKHLSVLEGTARHRGRAAAQRDRVAARASAGSVLGARLAAVTDRCWQCRTKVRGVVGVIVDPDQTADRSGFLPFDDVADQLARVIEPRALAARRIGELRHRDSPGVVGGYVANGCIECDALIGRFQLEDLLREHLHRGGTYSQLDVGLAVELPLEAAPGRRRAHR